MLTALLCYPRRERRAVAQLWARRSHAAQSAARIARETDADTVRRRALHDARGQIVREGRTYFGDGRVIPWVVRRSLVGRVDQFDVIVRGHLWRTGGARWVRRWLTRPSAVMQPLPPGLSMPASVRTDASEHPQTEQGARIRLDRIHKASGEGA